jgi:hypothetical protein
MPVRWDWELFKIEAEKALAKWWWLYLLIGFAGLPLLFLLLGQGGGGSTCNEVGRYADLYC